MATHANHGVSSRIKANIALELIVGTIAVVVVVGVCGVFAAVGLIAVC